MDWTELVVETTNEAIDAVTNILMENEAGGVQIDDDDLNDVRIITYFPANVNVAEKVPELEMQIKRLSQFGIDPGKATVKLSDVNDDSWRDVWKKYYHPVQVGEHLVVCPSWEAYDRQPDDVVLTLNPGMAFGTGTHDTTRLCMELLEKYITPQDTVLDVGCGSGILAITAALLGANKIIGCDIDEVAVKVAGENAALNGVQDRIAFHQGDLTSQVEGSFQIICANIVADVIIRLSEDAGRYLAKDGIFITSGIIDTREQDVLNALEQNGFQVIERRTSGGWVALACKAKVQ